MKIRTRLLIGFLLVVALLIVSSVIAYSGLIRMAAAVEAVNKEATTAIKALEIQSTIADATSPVRLYAYNGNLAAGQEFAELAVIVEERIAEMETVDLEGKESDLEYLAKGWTELRGHLTAVLEISDPVNSPGTAIHLTKVEGTSSQVNRYLFRVVSASQKQLLQARQEADATVRSTLQLLIVVALLALAAGLIVGLTVSRSITHAVATLTQAAERISMGELDAVVTLKSKDELGDLAQSFERMRISLKAAMDRLQRR